MYCSPGNNIIVIQHFMLLGFGQSQFFSYVLINSNQIKSLRHSFSFHNCVIRTGLLNFQGEERANL